GRGRGALGGGGGGGAAVGVSGAPADAACYSLVAGVSPGAEGGGIGLALKLAQRAWALGAGAGRMRWTFDPLLRRNAWFNIARLGAVGTEYWVDFYGEVADGVNDPETDRLAVAWDLRAPLPASAARGGGPGCPRAPGGGRAPAGPGPGGGAGRGARAGGWRQAAVLDPGRYPHHRARRPGPGPPLAARRPGGPRRRRGRGLPGAGGHRSRLVCPGEGAGPAVKIEAVELRVVRLPLVTPFRTSQHSQDERAALLVCAPTTQGEGGADCAVDAGPWYEPEFLSGARAVMAEYLVPMLMAAPDLAAAQVQPVLTPVKGHQMAKAALETAVLDAELRAKQMSFAQYLGAV